jgi:hypothetical protein
VNLIDINKNLRQSIESSRDIKGTWVYRDLYRRHLRMNVIKIIYPDINLEKTIVPTGDTSPNIWI